MAEVRRGGGPGLRRLTIFGPRTEVYQFLQGLLKELRTL